MMRHQLEAIFSSLKFKSLIINITDEYFQRVSIRTYNQRLKNGLESKMNLNDLG
jgi:hypothetical protein